MTEIVGKVIQILFRNEQNGYTVISLDTNLGQATVVGCMPFLCTHETVQLQGEYAQHPEYGEQFAVTLCRRVLPTKIEGIEAFLASPLFSGIGKKTAKLLTAYFQTDTLTVLAEHPERLTEVPGIGKKKAKSIAASYEKQALAQDTLVFLQGHGFTAGMALKVYRTYGAMAMPVVKQNPYRLIQDVPGIGFRTADSLARALGMEPEDEFRLQAGILYMMEQNLQNGHTACLREGLLQQAATLLSAQSATVSAALEVLIQAGRVLVVEMESQHRLYLPHLLTAEKNIVARLTALLRNRFEPPADLDRVLQSTQGFELSDEQKQSIAMAVQSGVCIITGGPGTGKTALVQSLTALFAHMGKKALLAAPTGRAAKRLSEATGAEAVTLHRLLEYAPADDSEQAHMVFQRNAQKPLSCHALILDECSMVNTLLFSAVLEALPNRAQLVLVGDADQLPPVGPGQVLLDLLQSRAIPTVRLRTIFRQGQGSHIVTNAHGLLHNQPMALNAREGDCFIDRRNSADEIREAVLALCAERLPKAYGYDLMRGTLQVLSPMRRGKTGVSELNLALQATLNPAAAGKSEIKMPWGAFRTGDRVLQTSNDYHTPWETDDNEGVGVFNGETGTVTQIDPREKLLDVLLDDGRRVTYDQTGMEDLDLAYCLSVHKAQGSEYPAVIFVCADGYPQLLTRNLLYTAMTRARKLCVFVGRDEQLQRMAANTSRDVRISGIKSLLGVEDVMI